MVDLGKGFQACRYELKYIIDEAQAAALRRIILARVVLDEHMKPESPSGYEVRSLYLDSPSLDLCRQTIWGIKNRFKLRIRFYNDRPDTPAFFEVKRRLNNVILKKRAAVHREALPHLLSGGPPRPEHLFEPTTAALDSLSIFCRLRDRVGATGQVYVAYRREAYVSPCGNDLRITFDRQLQAGRYFPDQGLRVPGRVATPRIGGVILELKFNNRFPTWLSQIVREFHFRRRSVPKYIECVRALQMPVSAGMPLHLGAAG